jgi:hypothetical protein
MTTFRRSRAKIPGRRRPPDNKEVREAAKQSGLSVKELVRIAAPFAERFSRRAWLRGSGRR